MRVQQRPIAVFLETFHKKIRDRNRREDIKRFRTNISRFCLQIKKIVDISMPDIQGYGNRTKPSSKLVDGYGRIVDYFDPGGYAPRSAEDPPDRAAASADIAKIDTHAAAEFGNLRHVFQSMI